jgi:hypothetical protein
LGEGGLVFCQWWNNEYVDKHLKCFIQIT